MTLPPTYYDFVCKLRPYVVELAEQDAQDLLAASDHQGPILSVDDYKSRFAQCMEQVDLKILTDASQKLGISIEQLRPHLTDALPLARAQFANLYSTINYEYHCLVNFAIGGKKTFYFNDNLSEHLANTEINLKANLVGLPFSSCLLVFTSEAVVNAMHNIRGNSGRRDVNTIGLDYSAPVSAFLTMLPAGAGLQGRKLMIVAWQARLPAKSYLMLKRELYLGDDWTLEQALRTDWETLTPDDLGIGIHVDSNSDTIEKSDDDFFYTDGLSFYRVVLNAVLYLSSDQAELIPKKSPRKELQDKAKNTLSVQKRRKVIQEAGRYSALDYEDVGSTVGKILIHKGDDEVESGRLGVSSKPLIRFMVRGHWRHQPHGAGNQERKLIWIRPHYKGPDLAALINKPYLVK